MLKILNIISFLGLAATAPAALLTPAEAAEKVKIAYIGGTADVGF